MSVFQTLHFGQPTSIFKRPQLWILLFMNVVVASLYYAYEYLWFSLHDWLQWLWYLVSLEFRYNINGMLIFIPLFYAIYVFGWVGGIIAWLFSLALLMPHIISFNPDRMSLLTNIFVLSAPLIVVSFINIEIKWREREKKHLTEREAERQIYLARVFQSQELERQRIARELHDDTTQRLLVIANQTQNLVSNGSTIAPGERKDLEQIRDEILELSNDVRHLSLDLRPSILDNLGLVPALRWLVDRLFDEIGIDAHLIVTGEVRKLPPEVEINLFRITQEALNNVRRHSKANKASVSLDYAPEKIDLKIEDNGVGLSFPDTVNKLVDQGKMGLIGIKERAKSIGGEVDITSGIGEGTRIQLSVNC
jgi:two-component system, NarL family, sensor histidine kinase DegS